MVSRAAEAVGEEVMKQRMRGTNTTEAGALSDLPRNAQGRTRSRPLTSREGMVWIRPDEYHALLTRIAPVGGSDVTIHTSPRRDDNGDLIHAEGTAPIGYLGGEKTPHPFSMRIRTHPETGETLHGIHLPELARSALETPRAIRTPVHADLRAFIESLGDTKHPKGEIKLLGGERDALFRLMTDKEVRPELGPGHVYIPTRDADHRPHVTREWHLGHMPSALGDTHVSIRAEWKPGTSWPHAMTIISTRHGDMASPATRVHTAPPAPLRPSSRQRRGAAPAEAPVEPAAPAAPAETPSPASRRRRGAAPAEAPAAPAGPTPAAAETAPSRTPARRRGTPTTPTADTTKSFSPFPFAIWPRQNLPDIFKSVKPWDKPEAKDAPNKAKNKAKWAASKRASSKKFGKKNSYVKNMWAVRHYNKHGGKWKKGE